MPIVYFYRPKSKSPTGTTFRKLVPLKQAHASRHVASSPTRRIPWVIQTIMLASFSLSLLIILIGNVRQECSSTDRIKCILHDILQQYIAKCIKYFSIFLGLYCIKCEVSHLSSFHPIGYDRKKEVRFDRGLKKTAHDESSYRDSAHQVPDGNAQMTTVLTLAR